MVLTATRFSSGGGTSVSSARRKFKESDTIDWNNQALNEGRLVVAGAGNVPALACASNAGADAQLLDPRWFSKGTKGGVANNVNAGYPAGEGVIYCDTTSSAAGNLMVLHFDVPVRGISAQFATVWSTLDERIDFRAFIKLKDDQHNEVECLGAVAQVATKDTVFVGFSSDTPVITRVELRVSALNGAPQRFAVGRIGLR
jgi:hypothetical protein